MGRLAWALLAPWSLGFAPAPESAPPPSDWSDFSEFEFVDEAQPEPASSTSDTNLVTQDPRSTSPASEIMSGSLRLTGAYLRFPDRPAPLPSGGDALLTTVGRLMIDHGGRLAKLEVNIFADLSRTPSFGDFGGAFASAGRVASPYRHRYLTVSPWASDDDPLRSSVGLDRAKLAFDRGPASFEVGRFPINDSVSLFFTPNDYFAPFSATAVNRIYKPGVDGARFAYAFGPLSSVEITGVLGFDDGYRAAWSHSAVMLRASTVQWGFEGSVHGGKVAQRWVAGASLQGDLGPVGVRAEGHVGVPDFEGDGRRGATDTGRPVHGRFAGGPNMNFDWHRLSVGAEYAFYSEGAASPSAYLDRAQRFFPDDLPYLARHYVGVNAGLEIVPVLYANALSLVNASDGSGLAALSFVYSVADEADLIGGLFVPWGPGPTLTDDPSLPADVRSEFGNSALTLYLESRVFF